MKKNKKAALIRVASYINGRYALRPRIRVPETLAGLDRLPHVKARTLVGTLRTAPYYCDRRKAVDSTIRVMFIGNVPRISFKRKSPGISRSALPPAELKASPSANIPPEPLVPEGVFNYSVPSPAEKALFPFSR